MSEKQSARHFLGEHAQDSRFSRTKTNTAKNSAPYGGYGQQYVKQSERFSSDENGYAQPVSSQAARAFAASSASEVSAPKSVREHRRRGAGFLSFLITLLIFAGIGAGAFWLWQHRSFEMEVDGQVVEVQAGTSIDELRELLGRDLKPGNLISVGGNLIEEGAGEAYLAIVNGIELSEGEKQAWRISGRETISLADGKDKVEDYSVEYEEVAPRLIFEGEYGVLTYVKQWGRPQKQEIRTGSISGEVVEGDIIQELQDCVIMRTPIHPDDGRKLVALTFDDGPSYYTPLYLEILNRYRVHATFFCLGVQVEEDAEMLQSILDQGSQICSHTYNHLQLTSVEGDVVRDEIASAAALIAEATAQPAPTIIRPPYGDFGETTWLQSNGIISASVLWGQDSEDWRELGVDEIVNSALLDVGNGSVILMHDGGGNRDLDLEALPIIIERLQAQGYELVTLSEMMAADSSLPEELSTGTMTMPEDAVWPSEIG